MTRKHKPPKDECEPTPTPHEEPTYTPEQVATAFANLRDWVPLTATGNENLDLIETAYSEALETAVPPKAPFQCWDATAPGYLVEQGLPRCICPSESNWFPSSARGAPDLEWIAKNPCPKYAAYDPLSIDIECYGKQAEGDEYKYMPQEIEWLRSVVEVHQRENPGKRVGIYMTPPERYGGCSPLGYPEGHPEYEKRWAAWTERNQIMLPLAKQSDVLFPSLYGLYSNMEQWVRFAKQNVEQCRMLDREKPLLGFIWPEWHNNADATGPIGYDDWMIMLETCFEVCDGAAIWHWSSSRFDPNAPWWKATVDFMTKHHLNGY